MYGEISDVVERFSLLLSCSTASCVLYNKTEHSRGFFLFYDEEVEESINFPKTKLYFPNERRWRERASLL